MKGITEERLNEIYDEIQFWDIRLPEVMDMIIAECTELSPQCQPIESAPKDREVFLIYPKNETYGIRKAVGYWDGQYYETSIDSLYGETPSHWQELPEDPK